MKYSIPGLDFYLELDSKPFRIELTSMASVFESEGIPDC